MHSFIRIGTMLNGDRSNIRGTDSTTSRYPRTDLTFLFAVACCVINVAFLDFSSIAPVQTGSNVPMENQAQLNAEDEAEYKAGDSSIPAANQSTRSTFDGKFHDAFHGTSDAYQPTRIALLASFVPQPKSDGSMTRVTMFDHIINKACYAYLWQYDFIFNATASFTDAEKETSPWLNSASWNRVPHLQAVLPDYEWVLYGHIDYIIHDMSRPVESFLREFELYNQTPSIFVPSDGPHFHFPSYAIFLKNSRFGNTVLQNWMTFAHGLCKHGNMPLRHHENGEIKYDGPSSDQPGLYYALMQTYEDVYKTGKMKQLCNTSSGYMRTTMDSAGEMDEYFKEVHLIHGHHREPLSDMKEQPIIWSTPTRKEASHDRGGLGLQAKYGPGAEENLKIHAFALHEKNNMGSDCKREVEYCKRVHGCYARYDSDGKFEVGCKDREFTVAQ